MGNTVRVEIPNKVKQKLLDGGTIKFQLPPQRQQVEFVEVTLEKENVFDYFDRVFANLWTKLAK